MSNTTAETIALSEITFLLAADNTAGYIDVEGPDYADYDLNHVPANLVGVQIADEDPFEMPAHLSTEDLTAADAGFVFTNPVMGTEIVVSPAAAATNGLPSTLVDSHDFTYSLTGLRITAQDA